MAPDAALAALDELATRRGFTSVCVTADGLMVGGWTAAQVLNADGPPERLTKTNNGPLH
jgi:hypothetical protein